MNMKIYFKKEKITKVKNVCLKKYFTFQQCGGEIMNNKNTLKMRVPGAKQAIENMKYEIASEFGVNLGPDATSRANGTVGGEITKRLVQSGLNNLSGSYNNQNRQLNKVELDSTFIVNKYNMYILCK